MFDLEETSLLAQLLTGEIDGPGDDLMPGEGPLATDSKDGSVEDLRDYQRRQGLKDYTGYDE